MAKFLANVIKLFSATLAGQILGILAMPILSRLYSPSDFGIFQLFFSIVSIVAVYSCLSYGAAIQLAKNDEDAANIVVLCILLIMVTTFFTTVILLFFAGYVDLLLAIPGFSSYILLLPFAIISSSLASLFIAWFSRKGEFGIIAKGNFISSVFGKSVSLGCGYLTPTPFGLILGTIMNDATIVLVLLRRIINDLYYLKIVSFEKMRQLARRYKKFPQYQVGADLAGVASTAVPPLILAIFFSSAIVGYFAMALMVIRLPSKLLGSALYQVFYQKACSEKNRTGSIKEIVETLHTRLITFGTFPCVLLMILGPELFTFALGTQWTTAGVYAQIVAPWMFFAFILVPLGAIFNVLEQQAADFWFSVVLFITRVFAVLVGAHFADPVLVMVLLSLTGVFLWGWMNMYILQIAGVSVSGAIKEILRNFLLSVLFCLPIIVAKFFSIQAIYLICIAIILSLLYYIVIIYRDTQLKQGLIDLLTRLSLNQD
jgi:lipopolysaccharide exporter